MDIVILIGRVLFAAVFVSSAVSHFTQSKQMAGYAQSKGVPMALPAVLGGGVLLGLGGLSVLFGIWPDLGALLLVVFLVPTAFTMHAFWRETEEQSRYMEMIQFFKDLGLAGASLMVLGLFAQLGDDAGLVIAKPLFG